MTAHQPGTLTKKNGKTKIKKVNDFHQIATGQENKINQGCQCWQNHGKADSRQMSGPGCLQRAL